MPCICDGALSGDEEFDRFIESEKGKETMELLKLAAININKFKVHIECNLMEFRQMFVKALLHMLIGCNENGNPTLIS